MSKTNTREVARRDPKRFGSRDVGAEFGVMVEFVLKKVSPSLTVRQAAEYVYANLDDIIVSEEYKKFVETKPSPHPTKVELKKMESYQQNKGCTKRSVQRTPKK